MISLAIHILIHMYNISDVKLTFFSILNIMLSLFCTSVESIHRQIMFSLCCMSEESTL